MNSDREDSTPAKVLLYVSARIGGDAPANVAIVEAVRELGRMVRAERKPPGENDLQIDLVFDVPGPILGVDYDGIRTGRLSRTERMLQVQVAVPEEIPESELSRYLAGVLIEILALVEEFVSDHRLDMTTEGLRSVIDSVVGKIKQERA